MYTVPQSEQLNIFLCSLGLGFLLGIVYDAFRCIRLSITKSKPAVVIFDFLYFAVLGVTTFLFILAFNKGEVRGYIIIGEFIGLLFYYFSFGITAIKLTNTFVKYLRKIYSLIFKIISAPFKLIYKVFYSISVKLTLVFIKTKKNSEKMQKKHLPKLRLYVYNLFGILLANKKSTVKGGKGIGKNNKEEKKA